MSLNGRKVTVHVINSVCLLDRLTGKLVLVFMLKAALASISIPYLVKIKKKMKESIRFKFYLDS